jgi:hypothetical protein
MRLSFRVGTPPQMTSCQTRNVPEPTHYFRFWLLESSPGPSLQNPFEDGPLELPHRDSTMQTRSVHHFSPVVVGGVPWHDELCLSLCLLRVNAVGLVLVTWVCAKCGLKFGKFPQVTQVELRHEVTLVPARLIPLSIRREFWLCCLHPATIRRLGSFQPPECIFVTHQSHG